MITPDPIFIGYPSMIEPNVIGLWYNHKLPMDMIIGTPVIVRNHLFSVQISYMINNPVKHRIQVILEPKNEIKETFWGDDIIKIIHKVDLRKKKEEEYPF